MNVNLKCFSSLSNPDSCNFNGSTTYVLNEGQTVEDLIQRAGIAPGDVRIAFVNHRKSNLSTILSHGDRVGLAPATGGM